MGFTGELAQGEEAGPNEKTGAEVIQRLQRVSTSREPAPGLEGDAGMEQGEKWEHREVKEKQGLAAG